MSKTTREDIWFLIQLILGTVLFLGPMIAVEWEGIRCAFFNK
jgi:hypothetical protein